MSEARPRSETFERYALGLARRDRLAGDADAEAARRRRDALRAEVLRLGAKGWPERSTFYTGELPAGCRPCLEGRGSNLCVTTRCSRECFFCFNPKPRGDGMSVHGRAVASEAEAPRILQELDVASVGLSGGEPLLDAEKTLRLARLLRERLGPGLRIDLYSNGDLFTPELLRRLKDAGVDALRVNLAANGYDPGPVRLGLEVFADVEVEIPAIPRDRERVMRLMETLEALGARHLILHELFASAQNLDALQRQGCRAKDEAPGGALSWSAVASSEETALELMRFALERRLRLGAYYCSCGTQQWIAETALARRAR
ncbi:MAG: radical SAM protein [Elusimicrobia bacterium]|nr:radical SAM protein [Elusimicrobiota bacterium]